MTFTRKLHGILVRGIEILTDNFAKEVFDFIAWLPLYTRMLDLAIYCHVELLLVYTYISVHVGKIIYRRHSWLITFISNSASPTEFFGKPNVFSI